MSTVIVKQNIKIPDTASTQAILVALAAWSGLIWLADDAQPVIGICPRWQISQSGRHTYWQQRGRDGQLGAAMPQRAGFADTVQQHWRQHGAAWQLPILEGFCGGLMGFLGYDWAAAQHGIDTVDHDDPLTSTAQACSACLGCYDIFLRHEGDGWQLYGADEPRLQPIYDQIGSCFEGWPSFRPTQMTAEPAKSRTVSLSNRTTLPTLPAFELQIIEQFAPRWSLADYRQAFSRVQDYLRAGDCYQVNLTQAFEAKIHGQLLSRVETLQQLTRAPYAGYLAMSAQHELLSCSPELFLSFLADGVVVTRPIKGTQPRDADPIQDAARRQQLAQSEKDQAENLMIVDLLRNDLARQARLGSVHVPKLFEIESFAQVHHLVSEIRATLAPDQSPLDLLFDALPGGSITGAPKIRAMQIIAELEADRRGAYCGSMGYLNADGTGRFNILIRTLERVGTRLRVCAGGGITIASDVDQEYQECLDKVGAILGCLGAVHG